MITTPDQRAALLTEYEELQRKSPPSAAKYYLRHASTLAEAKRERPAAPPKQPRAAVLKAIAMEPNAEKRAAMVLRVGPERYRRMLIDDDTEPTPPRAA